MIKGFSSEHVHFLTGFMPDPRSKMVGSHPLGSKRVEASMRLEECHCWKIPRLWVIFPAQDELPSSSRRATTKLSRLRPGAGRRKSRGHFEVDIAAVPEDMPSSLTQRKTAKLPTPSLQKSEIAGPCRFRDLGGQVLQFLFSSISIFVHGIGMAVLCRTCFFLLWEPLHIYAAKEVRSLLSQGGWPKCTDPGFRRGDECTKIEKQ